MRKILDFQFKDILFVLLIFLIIAAILFVELSGVNALRYKRILELLPDNKIVTKAAAVASLDKKALLLRNTDEITSNLAYEEFYNILNDMKVGYEDIDVSNDTIPSFSDYEEVIVLLSDVSVLDEAIVTLTEWVKSGGKAFFPLVLEGNTISDSIMQKLGIDDASTDFYTVNSIYVYEDFMIGGGSAYALTSPFECARTVSLAKSAEVFATAET